MSYPKDFRALAEAANGADQSFCFLTQCQRNAVDQLVLAVNNRRPLAILIGEGKSTSRGVVSKFLSRLDSDIAVARISAPCVDTTEFMGRIITAVGFQSKDLDVADLDSVFAMFLSFQKAHRQRTVICVEEVEDCDWWVLDKIRSLVESEGEGDYGMTLVLSGQSALKDLVTRRPLRSIAEVAGKQISLAPFTLSETREYVTRRIEADGIASVDEAFDYQAIPVLHELSRGVPDSIAELFSLSRMQAKEEGVTLVTEELVKRAYESQLALTHHANGAGETPTKDFAQIAPRPGRLIVQLTGQEAREIALRRGNILIGRSELCDLRIDSKTVSRHHALISYRPDGAVIVDLGSTNGTTVDGYPIKEHRLVAGDTVAVGDCRIEYILDDALDARFQDVEVAVDLELHP